MGSLTTTTVGFASGITDNLTLGLRVPFIKRRDIREPEHGHGEEEERHEEGDEHAEEEHEEEDGHDDEPVAIEDLGDPDGLGDVTLFGEYRFYQNKQTDTHFAALFGIKAPTGEDNEKSKSGFRLETEFQPGSGSWEGLLGLAATRHWGALALDSNFLYTVVTEGDQDTDLGDILSVNLALAYRLGGAETNDGHHHDEHNHHFWDVILELNGEWRDKDEIDGDTNGNSGGTLVSLAPGVRLSSTSGWFTALSVGVPVLEDLNGDQVDPQYRVFMTVGKGS